MTAKDLERFPRARFRDGEPGARDAIAGAPGAVRGAMADETGQVLTSQDGRTAHTPMVRFGAEDPVTPLTHAARHDPARVLCEPEARRARSEEHRTRTGGRRRTGRREWRPRSPCATPRLPAPPFAGHSGYGDSWRPWRDL